MDMPPTQEERAAIQDDVHCWTGADAALEQLIAAGCGRDEVETLLVRLRRALGTTPWSKTDLMAAAKVFTRGADKLRSLKRWGETRNLHLPDDSERWLSDRCDDLRLLAERLKERAPKADKRDNQRLGRAQARLIYYVIQKTGSPPPYVPLALLISAATDSSREPDTIRKWWKNNSKKYADVLRHD